jgi:lysine 2,3-aminomutase
MRRDRALTTIDDLVGRHMVAAAERADLDAVAARYAIAISPDMAGLIEAGRPDDPIARQFVPDRRELDRHPDERDDPIGDDAHSPVPGLVHRHADRVLLKLTGLCPVYCRFCFRREMIGPDAGRELAGADLDRAIAYIADQPQIFEVIMTGGDPLILSARRIADVTRRLAAIPHVSVLRWHSRVPVVAPERITDDLIAALSPGPKAVYLAIHTNHARELTPPARAAIGRLASAGVALLGQTVLLGGVNDDAAVLAELMRALVALRVRPYYLHHPDLAPGTAHFRISVAEGQAIVNRLRQEVTGLAMPTYVLDIPGGVAKVPIGPAYIDASHNVVHDPSGGRHALAAGADRRE